jgi:glutaryl-CoA dehydrogenase
MPPDPADLLDVPGSLSQEERIVQASAGRFVDERVLPIIQRCFEEH